MTGRKGREGGGGEGGGGEEREGREGGGGEGGLSLRMVLNGDSSSSVVHSCSLSSLAVAEEGAWLQQQQQQQQSRKARPSGRHSSSSSAGVTAARQNSSSWERRCSTDMVCSGTPAAMYADTMLQMFSGTTQAPYTMASATTVQFIWLSRRICFLLLRTLDCSARRILRAVTREQPMVKRVGRQK
ncbi:hypothetical protein EYF80_014267 [Liparis tanakae]|uniref:Uncharacterized protein n=1 Tax=Liparis tanakae TaxID=230148 RepID=A0A4Z2ID62_9TELE|nr:hypothetical protein EYF80_014267 [Liparis tanakae]